MADSDDPCEANPYDGFRCAIQHETLDGKSRLWLNLRVRGEVLYNTQIAEFAKDDRSQGDLYRQRCLLEAICRYLNAGGSVAAMQAVMSAVADVDVGTNMNNDWHLLLTLQDVPDVTHVFGCAGSNTALVVVEDLYTETIPLDELPNYMTLVK